MLGVVVALVGAVGMVSALTPSLPRRLGLLEGMIDPEFVHLAAGTTALLGLVLLLLGRGIARRHHSAYLAALGLLGMSAVTHLVKGLDVEETILAVGVAVLLVRARRQFTVKVTPGRWRRVLVVAVSFLVVDLALGLALVLVARGTGLRSREARRALFGAVQMLGGVTGVAHFHGVGHLIPVAMVLVGLATATAVLLVALGPLPDGPQAAVSAGLPSLADLTNRADGDTLDPFARRSDKRIVRSSDRAPRSRTATWPGSASRRVIRWANRRPSPTRSGASSHTATRGVGGPRSWECATTGSPIYEAAGLRAEVPR
ncbi:MAG: hypothetical protein U0W40_07295 [Acidimicrobiia bacterium]